MISVLATSLGAPTFGVGALALSMASVSAATTRDVAVATEALASAKASRVAADRRHTELAAQLDELTARLDAEFAGAAELAAGSRSGPVRDASERDHGVHQRR
ncbi:MAG: hypothetical protein V9G12_21840 [Microthrixaceae bacterium]